MKPKSNIYFFTSSLNHLDFLKELNKFTYHNELCFICYGTGNKAFKQAIKKANANEYVYQVKVGINKNEIIHQY